MSTPLTNLSECTYKLQGYTRAMQAPVRMLQDLTNQPADDDLEWERAYRWCTQMETVMHLLNQVADSLVQVSHQAAGVEAPSRAPTARAEYDGGDEGQGACIEVLERIAQLFEQSGELLEIADEQLSILWEEGDDDEEADRIDSELALLEKVGELFLTYAEQLSAVLDPELELF